MATYTGLQFFVDTVYND